MIGKHFDLFCTGPASIYIFSFSHDPTLLQEIGWKIRHLRGSPIVKFVRVSKEATGQETCKGVRQLLNQR